MHLIAILAAAGTFATRATCYAELPWLARFGRGALAMTVITGIYSRLGKAGSSKAGKPLRAVLALPSPDPQFAADASHEMKTPLTGIKAYLELLAEGDADDETTRAEFLQGIGSQVERLERAVDELLTTVRPNECREQSTATMSSFAPRKNALVRSERQQLAAANPRQTSND